MSPMSPGKACGCPGCSAIIPRGQRYCPAHASRADMHRGNSSERGYGRGWAATRAAVLRRDHYLCQEHKRHGELYDVSQRPGDAHVDHIIPKAQGGTDDESNLQTLCAVHHSEKTVREDGGFGRASRRGTQPVGGDTR